MTTISEWIGAQLDADERTAMSRKSYTEADVPWTDISYNAHGDHLYRDRSGRDVTDEWIAWVDSLPPDPDRRSLSTVAALRTIVGLHVSTSGMGYEPDDGGVYGDMSSVCVTCGTSDEYGVKFPCQTLLAVASLWSTRMGYRAWT